LENADPAFRAAATLGGSLAASPTGRPENAPRAELDTILAAIPGPDLAIQGDVVWAFAMIKGWKSEAERWGADAIADIIDPWAMRCPPKSSSDFTSAMAAPSTSTSWIAPTPGQCEMSPTPSGGHCIAN
jgi:hypothetical protein